MKIDKAIEILSEKRLPIKTAEDHDVLDATMLGIEALKWIEDTRRLFHSNVISPLPGETIEKKGA